MNGARLVFVGIVFLLSSRLSVARAYDVRIDADTSFQAYEVRSPASLVVWQRRRLVHSLALGFVQRLGASHDGEPAPRLRVVSRLRLHQEFGSTCFLDEDVCPDPTDVDEPGEYQPLARNGAVDALLAYAELTDLPWDSRLRVGRQLHWDPVGFARVDGVSARVEPLSWLGVSVIGGALARRSRFASDTNFVPVGAPQLDPEGVDPSRLSFVEEPSTQWLAGGTLQVGPPEAYARLVFREVFDADGTTLRRAGGALSIQPHERLRVDGDAVWSLVDGTLTDAHAGARFAFDQGHAETSLERHVPRFDWGTIWAYFAVAPTWRVRVEGGWEPWSDVRVSGALLGRLTELQSRPNARDAGAEASLALQPGRTRVRLMGSLWDGDLGPMASVRVSASRRITRWLTLRARGSVWHFESPYRQALRATSVSETLGVRIDVSEVTSASAQLMHATSRLVGHRFRALVSLGVSTWR